MRDPALAMTVIEEMIEPTFIYTKFLYFYISFSVWRLELATHSMFESPGRILFCFVFSNNFEECVCLCAYCNVAEGARMRRVDDLGVSVAK